MNLMLKPMMISLSPFVNTAAVFPAAAHSRKLAALVLVIAVVIAGVAVVAVLLFRSTK